MLNLIDEDCGCKDHEFVTALLEDILDRYFGPEYWDRERAEEGLSEEDSMTPEYWEPEAAEEVVSL